MGVELRISSSSTLRFTWATPGSDEGLAIDAYEGDLAPSDWIVDSLDVTDRTEWRSLLGRPIANIGLAFYSHDGESEDRPWSFSLGFDDGSAVAVSLGEVNSGELSYMPDNLVMIFDGAMARDYSVAESRSSALGQPIRG